MSSTTTVEPVRSHSVPATDPHAACRALADALGNDAALVMIYAAADVDRDALAAGIRDFLPGPVQACTTAGEITLDGCRDGTLTAVALRRPWFAAECVEMTGLRTLDLERVAREVDEASARLERRLPGGAPFGLLMVDGTSLAEERVLLALGPRLARMPVVGGSAAQGPTSQDAAVLVDGGLRPDAASLAIVRSELPFRAFKAQAYVPGDQRVVVTGADPGRRIVRSLDGEPAARRYAELLGCSLGECPKERLANHPLVLQVAGVPHVRSIRSVSPDGDLELYSTVEEGLVLRIGHPIDIVADLERALTSVRAELGDPWIVLGHDCVLRRMLIEDAGTTAELEALFRRFPVVGFRTFGEQFGRAHVNATFVGLAIGREPLAEAP